MEKTLNKKALKYAVDLVRTGGIIEMLLMYGDTVTEENLEAWVVGTVENYLEDLEDFGITVADVYLINSMIPEIVKALN